MSRRRPSGNPVTRWIKESAAWRSLFRQPYPTTSRTRALAVMNNVFLHLHPVRVKRHAVRYTYTFCLGGISFFLFLALTVTGLYLMFFYVPSISRAYQDIQAIEASVAFGALRAQHAPLGGAPHGADRLPAHDPRLLPRRLQAAARVQLGRRRPAALLHPGAQLHRLPAAVGPDRVLGHHRRHPDGDLRAARRAASRRFILLGGIEVGQGTLLRFYVAHVILFPLIAAIFMIVHFWRIRKDGGISGPV